MAGRPLRREEILRELVGEPGPGLWPTLSQERFDAIRLHASSYEWGHEKQTSTCQPAAVPCVSSLTVRRSVLAAAFASALVAGALPGAAHGARPLGIGFVDDSFQSQSAGLRTSRLDDAAALGAGVVRINVRWSLVAPAVRPAGFQAADPASPGYDWSGIDSAVRDSSARDLRMILTVISAPRWAEGARRPASAVAGTWRPSPSALGAFMSAAARRYSGAYPDPVRPGAVLPRVRSWQVWNEPNLWDHLAPQWVGRRLESPRIYRSLLNAAYAGIKSVRRDNVVASAGTAPYGDPFRGGRRVMPVRFLRALLCLSTRLRALRCPSPARLDAIAHHPYGVRGPRSPARNADDAAIPDIRKLTRVVRAAVRKRRVLPRRRKRVWVTEVSWDSRPPDPQGVPAARHAAWLADSFFQLWRQGVDTINWFGVRDQLPEPSYSTTYQSGVLLAGGAPKPAARAFRFPFAMTRAGRRGGLAWGRAPAAGTAILERRRGSGWRAERSVAVRRGGTFLVRLRKGRGRTYRARVGREVSPAWRLR